MARYNGPDNEYDAGNAMAVDSSGNIYVTGESVGSGTSGDYITIKYNAAGQQQWVARYHNFGNSGDVATAIAIDSFGNVHVTGTSGFPPDNDYATVKYNSAGQEQWVARYSGPGNSYDYATGIAVDGSGNVYVTGQGGGSAYATIKYNASGQEQWVARYNGPANVSSAASGIALDSSGNVYVTGGSAGPDGYHDYATIKYNPSGQEQWVARYNGSGNANDGASAIAIDSSGNIYVTGSSLDTENDFDCVTIKYDPAGQERWVARYNGPANRADYGYALAVDKPGNVYLTGASYRSANYFDYLTIKYNTAGQEEWVGRYSEPGDFYNQPSGIAIDGSGNVYVTGGSYTPQDSGYDYATISTKHQANKIGLPATPALIIAAMKREPS